MSRENSDLISGDLLCLRPPVTVAAALAAVKHFHRNTLQLKLWALTSSANRRMAVNRKPKGVDLHFHGLLGLCRCHRPPVMRSLAAVLQRHE